MRRLDVDHREYLLEADKLADLIDHLDDVSAARRKLIAEIALLRLFAVLETTIASVATKLCCGTAYCDGTLPVVLHASHNMTIAQQNMRTVNRTRAIRFLKWTQAGDIKDNVKHLISNAEPFVQVVDAHALLVNELRCVRNHIAHQNAGTRGHFKLVVKQHYGAYFNAISPGALLLTPKFTPCLFQQYVLKSKVLIRAITKA